MALDAASHGIEPTQTGVTIRVYVAPRSSSNKVAGAHNGELKVALTAQPVERAANRALVEFIARVLDVPRTNISLTAGASSRHKVLRIEGIEVQAVWRKLGFES